MIQYRRLGAMTIGVWLGMSVFADVAVTQNFATVDRFLAAPGSITAATELHNIGRARERILLRRNAGEENNFIFENWERAEFAIGAVLLALLLFGGKPDKPMLLLNLAMLAAISAQHFYLSPAVTDLGRIIADIPPDLLAKDPRNTQFWTFHGMYSASEILKLLLGIVLAARLCLRLKSGPDHLAAQHG